MKIAEVQTSPPRITLSPSTPLVRLLPQSDISLPSVSTPPLNSNNSSLNLFDSDQQIRVLTPLEIMKTLPVLQHQDGLSSPPSSNSSPYLSSPLSISPPSSSSPCPAQPITNSIHLVPTSSVSSSLLTSNTTNLLITTIALTTNAPNTTHTTIATTTSTLPTATITTSARVSIVVMQ